MQHWLDLFTPYTWSRFRERGSSVSGFRERQRKTAYEKVQQGDIFVCYLTKLSRWCGVLKIESTAFEENTPIFADENDPFTVRFKVKPVVELDFEYAIPIEIDDIWTRLSFTRAIARGAFGWGQTAGLRQSLVKLPPQDGDLLVDALERQSHEARRYPLEAGERRHVEQRTVVRTERGEVEVEVPERSQVAAQPELVTPEVRESVAKQADVAALGAALGFTIWIPASDRSKVASLLPQSAQEKLLTTLPVNFDSATNKTIEY